MVLFFWNACEEEFNENGDKNPVQDLHFIINVSSQAMHAWHKLKWHQNTSALHVLSHSVMELLPEFDSD